MSEFNGYEEVRKLFTKLEKQIGDNEKMQKQIETLRKSQFDLKNQLEKKIEENEKLKKHIKQLKEIIKHI
ncbi:MAG: hypothetical protein ACXAAI_05450 [Promethearchaeota archaeon]|jgi:regulator of replication initiation timing